MFQFPAFAPCNYEFIAELMSFLIQKSPDRSLVADSPEHIAGSHVFRRFSMPRHPPCTLNNLTTFIDHRHAKYQTHNNTPQTFVHGSMPIIQTVAHRAWWTSLRDLRPSARSIKVFHRKGARRDTYCPRQTISSRRFPTKIMLDI